MVKLICVSVVACTLGLCTLVLDQPQDEPKMETTPSRFMLKKLDDSCAIVSGLATNDFDGISKAAQNLLLLSHESDWNVIQTKPYLRMSSDFRHSAARLRDAANEENIDGATLAYFEVTMSCVRCHQYLRGQPQALEIERR